MNFEPILATTKNRAIGHEYLTVLIFNCTIAQPILATTKN